MRFLDVSCFAGEEAKTERGRKEEGIYSSKGKRRAGVKKTAEGRTPGKISFAGKTKEEDAKYGRRLS